MSDDGCGGAFQDVGVEEWMCSLTLGWLCTHKMLKLGL